MRRAAELVEKIPPARPLDSPNWGPGPYRPLPPIGRRLNAAHGPAPVDVVEQVQRLDVEVQRVLLGVRIRAAAQCHRAPPPPNGPPNPPPNPPPRPPPPPGGALPDADSTLGPMPKVRPTRRFTATEDGLLPRDMGTIGSPAWGTTFRAPKLVCTTLLAVADGPAYEGRSLKKLSPVRS